MTIFVSTPYSLESHCTRDGCINYEISHHANMQMCKLLRIIFYDNKVVPLTKLAAMEIDFRDVTHPKPCNVHSFSSFFLDFRHFY